MKKVMLLLLFLPLFPSAGIGQVKTNGDVPQADSRVVTFRFVSGKDMFYSPWRGNDTELSRLYALVDEYRPEIMGGSLPVYVNGYYASGENARANYKIAFIRSNRVKSELITCKGLREEHFITKNHSTAYTAPDGTIHRNIVVVTLRIPAKAEQDNARLEQERLEREAAEREAAERERQAQAEREQRERDERERAERERADAERAAREQAERDAMLSHTEPVTPAKPFCFEVRTNLLYGAFLTPTFGVEWRVSPSVGIKADGSMAYWGNKKGKVQKLWLLNPEVRWYLLDNKRFYVGAGANFGEYNIYKGMLGSLFSDDTGHQGKLWGAGVTVGYRLYLARAFSLDFNLGLGYTSLEYDRFNVISETRLYKDKDQSKNFWGPTQAGISLVWTISGNK